MKKYKIAPEVKGQIINRIKNDGVSVAQAALDHGVSEGIIYTWISKKVEGATHHLKKHQTEKRK